MKNKKSFFDRNALKWDSYERMDIGIIIEKLFEKIFIKSSDIILDVGCGTGILVPHLEKRKVSKFYAIDISDKMVGEYLRKFPGRNVVVGDYQKYGIFKDNFFTKIIIFNAFPHFEDPESVFKNSYNYLKSGGGLYIIHSMSREELNEHHRKAGMEVKDDILISDESFYFLFTKTGFKDILIDSKKHFFASGIKP